MQQRIVFRYACGAALDCNRAKTGSADLQGCGVMRQRCTNQAARRIGVASHHGCDFVLIAPRMLQDSRSRIECEALGFIAKDGGTEKAQFRIEKCESETGTVEDLPAFQCGSVMRRRFHRERWIPVADFESLDWRIHRCPRNSIIRCGTVSSVCAATAASQYFAPGRHSSR